MGGAAVLTLELSEQMGDGKGHRLQGMCWLLEEDESSTTFGKEKERLDKGEEKRCFFFFFFLPSFWAYFCCDAVS